MDDAGTRWLRLRETPRQYLEGATWAGFQDPEWVRWAKEAVKVIPRLAGSNGHFHEIIISDSRNPFSQQLPPNAVAAYTAEDGGKIIWRKQSAFILQNFLLQRYTTLSEKRQLAFLRTVKTELMVFLHEGFHGTGPGNRQEFEALFARRGQTPATVALHEGFTDLLARERLDDFIIAMGMEQIDPRILQVEVLEGVGYPGQVALLQPLVAATAARRGVSITAELNQVVADGADATALMCLMQRATDGRVPQYQLRSVGEKILQDAYRLRVALSRIRSVSEIEGLRHAGGRMSEEAWRQLQALRQRALDSPGGLGLAS